MWASGQNIGLKIKRSGVRFSLPVMFISAMQSFHSTLPQPTQQWWDEKATLYRLASIPAAKCTNVEFSPKKIRLWNSVFKLWGVNCTARWTHGDIRTIYISIYININSYSASHDNWCTATLWNRIMTAQCEGMGEVGSARYEPALLPPCPSIRVLSYSNCQEIHSPSRRAWQCKCSYLHIPIMFMRKQTTLPTSINVTGIESPCVRSSEVICVK